ncbi:MAG: hypothetical protein WC770_03010 [Phycisphaerae bacterium]
MIKSILMIAVSSILIFSFGCKHRRQQASPPPPKSVITDIQKEAAEQITEKNMDAELDKMEKEITADVNSQR